MQFGGLVSWLAGCLADWLAGWLPGCLAGWLTGLLAAWRPGGRGKEGKEKGGGAHRGKPFSTLRTLSKNCNL